MTRRFPFLLIILLGLVVYANSLSGEFVWDDNLLIKDNVFIKSWSYIPEIFSTDLLHSIGIKANFYRPIQTFSYLIDYSIGGLNPIGYHLTNIILHILVALTVFWFIDILYDDNILSTVTAVFFLIHPVLTEVSCYISTRAESLYLLFFLLAFIFYIKSIHSKNIKLYILMISSYALSLLSKEASLIFPVLLILYHYTFKEKIRAKEFLTILGMICAYVVLRTAVMQTEMQFGLFRDTTVLQRLPGFFVAITNYVRLLFLPIGLHMQYGHTLFSFSNPQAILGIIIAISMIFFAVKTAKTNRLIFFGLSWFFIGLLPISNIYPINAYMSENWLYLPSIGFFVIVAHFIKIGTATIFNDRGHLAFKARCPRKHRKKWSLSLFFIVLTTLIIFYSSLTIIHSNYWKDAITLYERTLKFAPNSARINYNLGNEYRAINKYKAIELYNKAIELNRNYPDPYNNLGLTYIELDKKNEAIKSFKKAIEIDPEHAISYYNLANIYAEMGENNEAIRLYKKAIDMNRYYIPAYNNLASIYGSIGREEEAIALWKKIIELDPNSAMSHLNLSRLYREMGMREEASSHFDKALLLQGK